MTSEERVTSEEVMAPEEEVTSGGGVTPEERMTSEGGGDVRGKFLRCFTVYGLQFYGFTVLIF